MNIAFTKVVAEEIEEVEFYGQILWTIFYKDAILGLVLFLVNRCL